MSKNYPSKPTNSNSTLQSWMDAWLSIYLYVHIIFYQPGNTIISIFLCLNIHVNKDKPCRLEYSFILNTQALLQQLPFHFHCLFCTPVPQFLSSSLALLFPYNLKCTVVLLVRSNPPPFIISVIPLLLFFSHHMSDKLQVLSYPFASS